MKMMYEGDELVDLVVGFGVWIGIGDLERSI